MKSKTLPSIQILKNFIAEYDRKQRRAKRILQIRAYLEYISAFIIGLVLFVLMSINYEGIF